MNNTYTVIRELGRGAAGVVSLVRRKSDRRTFAAKQVDFSADALAASRRVTAGEAHQLRQRLMKEVRVMQQLPHHPSIVTLEEVIDTRDGIIVVMEYVDGGCLQDLVYPHGAPGARTAKNLAALAGGGGHNPSSSAFSPRDGADDFGSDTWGDAADARRQGPVGGLDEPSPAPVDPFPEDRITQWLLHLINAVKFLHDHGVAHRDIKLQNILVTSANHLVKIADFGVAENLLVNGQVANATTTVGTPMYMAPELCDGTASNTQSDIWSLGVVAYELCCRRPPFVGGNMLALAAAITDHGVSRIDPVYSDELDAIVRGMLTKDPKRRPTASVVAGQLRMRRQGASAEALVAFAGLDLATLAAPPSASESPRQPSRRPSAAGVLTAQDPNSHGPAVKQQAVGNGTPRRPAADVAADSSVHRDATSPVPEAVASPGGATALQSVASSTTDPDPFSRAEYEAESRRQQARLDALFPDTPRTAGADSRPATSHASAPPSSSALGAGGSSASVVDAGDSKPHSAAPAPPQHQQQQPPVATEPGGGGVDDHVAPSKPPAVAGNPNHEESSSTVAQHFEQHPADTTLDSVVVATPLPQNTPLPAHRRTESSVASPGDAMGRRRVTDEQADHNVRLQQPLAAEPSLPSTSEEVPAPRPAVGGRPAPRPSRSGRFPSTSAVSAAPDDGDGPLPGGRTPVAVRTTEASVDAATHTRSIACRNCRDGGKSTAATVYCDDCPGPLCGACNADVHRHSMLAKHTVVAFGVGPSARPLDHLRATTTTTVATSTDQQDTATDASWWTDKRGNSTVRQTNDVACDTASLTRRQQQEQERQADSGCCVVM